MFKKGFLLQTQPAREGKDGLNTTSRSESEGTHSGALPVELLIQVIEQLAGQSAESQRSIASLRLSSKLLNRIATPYFYKVIQLSSHAHSISLVHQLQAQPKLCESTRSIWWNDMPDINELKPIEAKERLLVKFANVDEVAYCANVKTPLAPAGYALGVHYALRDVGSWCEPVSFLRPEDPLDQVQRTPTLDARWNRKHIELMKYFQLPELENWQRNSPSRGEHSAHLRENQPKRAVWALHVAMPALLDEHAWLWETFKTITHLTITLYSHEAIDHDSEMTWEYFERLVDPRNMPLLEYLDVRVSNIGEGPNGLRNVEEVADEESEGEPWDFMPPNISRPADVELALDAMDHHSGFNMDYLLDPSTPQETLFEDVPKYMLHEWQERVFEHRIGPWKDPQTRFVRPQVVGSWREGEWEAGTGYKFAEDADFEINRTQQEAVWRRNTLFYLRERQQAEREASLQAQNDNQTIA